MIGIMDIHCPNCGNYEFVSPRQIFGRKCGRCGVLMDPTAPTEEVRLRREQCWLATAPGQEWQRQQALADGEEIEEGDDE